jgi:hypothetical protein
MIEKQARTLRVGWGSPALTSLAAIVLTGCALGPPSGTAAVDVRRGSDQDPQITSAKDGPTTLTGAFAGVDLAFDRKSWRSPGPELAWGEGYALAIETGLPDGSTSDGTFTMAAEYARTEHAEIHSRTHTELHLASWMVCLRPWEFGGEDFAFGPRFCVGIGAMVADHAAGGPSDDITATVTLGLDLELRVFRHVVMRAGGRGVFAGFPGDTVATGGIMYVGGGIRF